MLARPTVITVAHPNVDVVLWRNCHFLLRSIRGHGSALEGKGRRAKRCAGKEMKARSRCWISNPRPSAEQQDYEGSEQSSRSKQRCTTTVSQLRLSNYAGTVTLQACSVRCSAPLGLISMFFFFFMRYRMRGCTRACGRKKTPESSKQRVPQYPNHDRKNSRHKDPCDCIRSAYI